MEFTSKSIAKFTSLRFSGKYKIIKLKNFRVKNTLWNLAVKPFQKKKYPQWKNHHSFMRRRQDKEDYPLLHQLSLWQRISNPSSGKPLYHRHLSNLALLCCSFLKELGRYIPSLGEWITQVVVKYLLTLVNLESIQNIKVKKGVIWSFSFLFRKA